MPFAERSRSWIAIASRRRFGTKAARFHVALSSGFVIAALGASVFAGGNTGNAQDFLGALTTLFAIPQTANPQASQGEVGSRQVRARPRRASAAYDGGARAHPRVRHAAAREAESGAGSGRDTPMRLGRASMCVRLCDGFAFPVGAFHGEGDLASHEATCRSECPGARTALYVLPNGASALEEAVEARTGTAYSQKAAGFHYTTYLDESCSCHPKEGNRIASLLHDFTLRRGDAVMTPTGVRVFHGGSHFPFRQADFVQLAQSRDVRKTARATFHSIERASLVSSHPAVAEAAKPVPPKAADLRALQHQASLAR